MELDETVREFLHGGILCEPIILGGHPTEQIALLAKSRRVDRVIVGTRYASGIARLVEPSVAEELTPRTCFRHYTRSDPRGYGA